MSGSLEECWSKFRWAERYRKAFNEEVSAFYRDNPYEIVHEANSHKTRHEFKVTGLRAIPRDWALIVGDTLYNYRATLDYLVYQLALNVKDPLDRRAERRCMFPICDTPARFKAKGRPRIDMLGQSEQALIEHLQPYDGNYFSPHTFGVGFLENVHIIDKHRRLNVIHQVVERRVYLNDPDIRWDFSGDPLEEGAVVAVAHCSVPKPDVQMHPDVSIGVTLREPPIGATLALQLDLVAGAVRVALSESAQFFR